MLPDGIVAHVEWSARALPAAIAHLREASSAADLPSPTRWSSAPGGPLHALDRLPRATRGQPRRAFSPLAEGLRLEVSVECGRATANLDLDPSAVDLTASLSRALALFAALSDRGLCAARIRRVAGNGGHYAPEPPLADSIAHVLLATDDEIEACYEDRDGYLLTWEKLTPLKGKRWLLSRAFEAHDNLAFKEATYDQQWELARLARPGLTKYYAPDVEADERAHFERGPATLRQVGYSAATQRLELTCVTPDNGHLAPRELYFLRSIVQARSLDGQPVESVLVSFPTRALAQREARPLLDVGVRVLFLDGRGRAVELGRAPRPPRAPRPHRP